MIARDCMKRNVVSVEPADSIYTALRLMLARGISGLPVIDKNGVLAGIVTEGDFLRRVENDTVLRRPRWLEFLTDPGRLAGEYIRSASRRVSEIMTTDVATVTEDATLADVARLMERRNVKRVPVMRDSKVVGLVTRSSLLHALVRGAERTRTPPPENDEAIRNLAMERLHAQRWLPKSSIDVMVRNGVARLSGIVTDEREKEAIRVVVENTPGIVSVENGITYIDPITGIVVEPSAASSVRSP